MSVIALSKIKHNGVLYEKGDVINDVTPSQVKRLQELNVVEIKTEETVSKVDPKKEAEIKGDSTASEDENKNEVASIVPTMSMTKPKIMGIGITRGLELDKTKTKEELIKEITDDMATDIDSSDEAGE